MQFQVPRIQPPPMVEEAVIESQCARKLFRILFYLHLASISLLVVALTTLGAISYSGDFHPKKWYPPLLTSIASAGVLSLIWQWIILWYPSKAFRAAFWVSPSLTCAVAILLLLVGSMTIGALAMLFGIVQFIYVCWVTKRFVYAIKILTLSTAFPPPHTTKLVTCALLAAVLYSAFLVAGLGGASTTTNLFYIFCIFVILLSLAWTMQVIKNLQQVIISRIKYINLATGAETDIKTAYRDAVRHLIGSVCIGSALAPLLVVIRGLARGITLLSGDRDEFLFSCANCFDGVTMKLIRCGNRWGFVHVGVSNRGFVESSSDTWDLFESAGLGQLIDSDLMGSFCFLSGVAGGALCSLIGGIWAFVIYESYVTQVSLYAFFIAYFICRIAMAWPQACVSAYYVAFAENPQNDRFDWTIPARIQQLRNYNV